MKTIFTNELGNEITIQVKKFDPVTGTMYIAIHGPNSSTTNIITVKEAEVLLDLLGKALLPRHECGLHLTHNNHRDYYETVEQYMTNPWMEDVTISPEEKQKMIDTNEIWELQWYPNTPIGSYTVVAATLEEVLKKAKEVEDNI